MIEISKVDVESRMLSSSKQQLTVVEETDDGGRR